MNQILLNKFVAYPRSTKRLIMLMFDAVVLTASIFIAFSLRLGEWYQPTDGMAWLILLAPLVAIPIFVRFGLYRAIIRYIGFKAIWAVAQAVSLYALVWGLLVFISGVEGVSRSAILINWLVAVLAIGSSRIAARFWVASMLDPMQVAQNGCSRKSVAVYGAGDAGVQLATALSYSKELKPVAFIDDDASLRGQQVNGLKVHSFIDLSYLIEQSKVEEVLLALPSVSRARRKEIISMLEPYPVHVRILPGVAEMAQGRVQLGDLRDVSIDDLLGRDAVAPNERLLHSNVTSKVVMVTGAGGSIGSELCRQIIRNKPEKLILFEQSEFALYSIEKELSAISDIELVPILGSVIRQSRLERICKRLGVQTIYHAAAYKHVPMVEMNVSEGIQNNIFGTMSCAKAALKSGVDTFVLVSTDKAVRPTNVMGCTKRICEMVLQAISDEQSKGNAKFGSTCFTMVRFGNVVGSSGSVVPYFKQQIRQGGPVTVTDPKIIRYFMAIPEAAQLVIQAGAMGQGGDVFVLDMGEPVRILDLAKKMIHLSGLQVRDEKTPNGDIEITFTGLRPGEKLYEELLIGDNVLPTDHAMIMRAEEELLSWNELQEILGGLQEAMETSDHETMRHLLIKAVPDYKPQCGIQDVLYMEDEPELQSNVLEMTGS